MRKEAASSSSCFPIVGEGCSGARVFQQLLQQLGVEDEPVDFQLPGWLKQQKSMPYTFISLLVCHHGEYRPRCSPIQLSSDDYRPKDVYINKKMKRRTADDGIFCSCSPSAISSVCDRGCLCGMLLSTCSRSCKCGNVCVNKPFQYRTVKKMKLIKTEKCGSGVVADEDIKQGDFVIEYVGEVIDDKTCEERLWKMKYCGETNFYLCEINRDMVIDATYKGNMSRFINHSCQPNTEMQKWTIDGETRIGIFATRNVRKGEELTYDYQFVQFGPDQDCYCGSTDCRQKLGNKPSKLKISSSDTAWQLVLSKIGASSPTEEAIYDVPFARVNIESSNLFFPRKKKSNSQDCIGERVRIWCHQYNRYYGGVIIEFNFNSGKHTILMEDERVENLDLSKEDWDLL